MCSDVGVRWWKHSPMFGIRNYNLGCKRRKKLVLLYERVIFIWEIAKCKMELEDVVKSHGNMCKLSRTWSGRLVGL